MYFKVLIAAAVIVCVLVLVPQAEAAPSCNNGPLASFCFDKTASPNPAFVGQPLTFTIRGFCTLTNTSGCAHGSNFGAFTVTDTLPQGLKIVTATATGVDPVTCSITTTGNTVTCTPETYCNGDLCPTGSGEKDYVEKIVAIPTQTGSFTNTATETFMGSPQNTAQATFTVVQPRHKHHHRHHHHH